jgi:hypothetical protein
MGAFGRAKRGADGVLDKAYVRATCNPASEARQNPRSRILRVPAPLGRPLVFRPQKGNTIRRFIRVEIAPFPEIMAYNGNSDNGWKKVRIRPVKRDRNTRSGFVQGPDGSIFLSYYDVPLIFLFSHFQRSPSMKTPRWPARPKRPARPGQGCPTHKAEARQPTTSRGIPPTPRHYGHPTPSVDEWGYAASAGAQASVTRTKIFHNPLTHLQKNSKTPLPLFKKFGSGENLRIADAPEVFVPAAMSSPDCERWYYLLFDPGHRSLGPVPCGGTPRRTRGQSSPGKK